FMGDNCEEAGFCRFPRGGLAFEHTLFVDINRTWERATARGVNDGYRARGFAFNPVPDAGGVPANDVVAEWYGQTDARWQYDPNTGRYLRYTSGVPHMDAADGTQLWADNVVFVEALHDERPDLFPPGANYWSMEIQLWDQGRAYLVRDGQMYEGFWRRQDREPGSALQLLYGDNTPMMMKPGRTFVQVVRGLGNVTISGDYSDMAATSTTVFLSATPTFTVTPGPSPTPPDPNSVGFD
ncbi:MAG: DUF3048 C-terminal domain-containing protein, partial [Burkholderiales bacterium]|nr:DUF3048 C-terminal domain-containing protein [Anaerolineae bacterium]